MNTMEITKIVAGLCGSLLIFLVAQFFISEPLYQTSGHGDELAYSFEIEEGTNAPEEEEEVIDYVALLAAADPGAGEKDFRKCSACHKVDANAHGVGPSLHAIVGRAVGAIDGFNYSGAMAGFGGEWTPERLAEFLHNPKGYIAGTKMSFAGYRDPADAANMVAYLETLN
ncbi:MAG: cytochrome c family protein [Pseudomonadota bacterium]